MTSIVRGLCSSAGLLIVACTPLLISNVSNVEPRAKSRSVLQFNNYCMRIRICPARGRAYCPVTYLHKKLKAKVNGFDAWPGGKIQLLRRGAPASEDSLVRIAMHVLRFLGFSD